MDDKIREINLQGAIALGGQTLKSLELVNGGAAIAILTFYGNSAKSGTPAGIDVVAIKISLIAFGVGVAFAVISSCAAYISQVTTQHSNQEGPGDAGLPIRYVAIACGLVSLVLFVVGVVSAAISFK